MSAGVRGWLHRRRFAIARRGVQIGTLLAFFGTLHWGWQIAGRPLLAGNLSSSSLLDAVPLADPFAVLQILATGHLPLTEVLLGSAIVLGLYAYVGGRSFCAWVCPVNMLTDAAEDLRRRLGLRSNLRLPRSLRYVALGLTLLLSAWLGVAAFEWVSPIGLFHREVIYGVGFGLAALAGLLVFDALVLRHGWCGHLCPLGAFWAQVGRVARVRVRFDEASCTECGDCVKACPEPQVLNLRAAAEAGMVRSGECTNCARCIAVCPEGSLSFALRGRISSHQSTPTGRPAPPLNGRSAS
jgi:ferredoxin-type protein NapH